MEKILIRNIDLERWRKLKNKRILVYGRRKTGKTFFVKRFTEWDYFFFVKRDGGILDLDSKREISYDYLTDLLLNEKKRFVIDEFHRLPEEFLDFLQAYGDKLNLTLITSTLWLSRKILGESSPLLGIFQEFKLGLIDERDVLNFLSKERDRKRLVEKAVYLREPWLIPLVENSRDLPRILIEQKNTIERLVGEIFREEERELKKSYVAILAAISSGKTKSSEISSFMFSRKLLPKDDPSLVQGYLKTLCNIGLLNKIEVFNKKFNFYLHASPLLDLYFLLDAKYGFSETELPQKEVERVFLERLPFHVELFFGSLLSKLFGLKFGKIVEKDFEINIALSSFKKIKVVCEVKWKDFVSAKEAKNVENVLNKIRAEERMLIVPHVRNLEVRPHGVKVIDVNKILKMIKHEPS